MTRRSSREVNDLEHEQAGTERWDREDAEGEDADLTELAAPQPIDPSQARQDDFEKEERKARSRHSGADSEDGDEFLTEVAAPPPVDRGSGHSSRSNSIPEDVEEKAEHQSKSGPPPSRRSRYLNEVYVVSWLIFFSLLGTLARLGVEAITTYPGTPFPSTVLWANVGGSFAMGFLLEDRKLFRLPDKVNTSEEKHASFKKGLPLFIGLSTGFCGSFTSFSTFITDAFLALTNDLPNASASMPYHVSSEPINPRNGGYSFMAALAILMIQPAMSFAALITGAHLALALQPIIFSLPADKSHHIVDPAAVVLAFGCWIGAFVLAVWPPAIDWRPRAVYPLVFAPLGTLTRFYCSKHLNGRIPSFPLGTFVVNIFGTCIEGMCYDLQHTVTAMGGSRTQSVASCAVLTGVMQGFCGCATTVSTWMAELNSLEKKHKYVYGLMSVAVALGFQVVIMGSVGWSIGFKTPSCEG